MKLSPRSSRSKQSGYAWVIVLAVIALGAGFCVRPSETTTPDTSVPTVPTTTSSTAPIPTPPVPSSEPPVAPAPPPAPSGRTLALDVLATLEVKGRAPKTGYDRDQFGPSWVDVDGNGCDTRNDILARDLTEIALDPDGCTVRTGVLADPYTGQTIPFQRGQTTSSAVQIDHVVALSDAWQKGAQDLSPDQHCAFANDPLNLLAVDGPANQQKGDGDAATWLPSNRSFHCNYVARQIAVKARYGLWVTAAERDAMSQVLSTCPGHPLPA